MLSYQVLGTLFEVAIIKLKRNLWLFNLYFTSVIIFIINFVTNINHLAWSNGVRTNHTLYVWKIENQNYVLHQKGSIYYHFNKISCPWLKQVLSLLRFKIFILLAILSEIRSIFWSTSHINPFNRILLKLFKYFLTFKIVRVLKINFPFLSAHNTIHFYYRNETKL